MYDASLTKGLESDPGCSQLGFRMRTSPSNVPCRPIASTSFFLKNKLRHLGPLLNAISLSNLALLSVFKVKT